MDFATAKIASIYNKLTKYQKISIISALIAGFFAHGYAMGNNYIYHDATILNGLGTTFGLGRWALGFMGLIFDRILGNYNLPFFNVLVSILFISASAAVVTKTLRVKSDFISAFIGAIFAVYPVVTSTFAYNFSATFYFLALFLAVASISQIAESYISEKEHIKNYVVAVVLLTLSAGFYQAYLSVAVTLALSVIMLDLVTGNRRADDNATSSKNSELSFVIFKGIGFIATFIVSLVLYLIINKISTAIMKPPATGYQGAENMGALNLARIPSRFVQTYLHFFYIKWNGINAATCMWVFIVAFIGIAAIIIIVSLVKRRVAPANLILFILAIAVMPIAVNLVYLMSTDDNFSIHTLMRYATVFVLITPVVLVDALTRDNEDGTKGICKLIPASPVLLTVITLCYIYANNVAYIKMNLVQEEMNAFFTVLEARICETEGYNDNMPVTFYGEYNIVDEKLTDINEVYKDTVILGYEYNARELINRESWKNYMKYHVGFAPEVIDMPGSVLESEKFADLQVYPDAGSIKIIDGIVTVKLSE